MDGKIINIGDHYQIITGLPDKSYVITAWNGVWTFRREYGDAPRHGALIVKDEQGFSSMPVDLTTPGIEPIFVINVHMVAVNSTPQRKAGSTRSTTHTILCQVDGPSWFMDPDFSAVLQCPGYNNIPYDRTFWDPIRYMANNGKIDLNNCSVVNISEILGDDNVTELMKSAGADLRKKLLR